MVANYLRGYPLACSYLTVALLAQTGCANFHCVPQSSLAERAEAQACFDVDVAYLEKLNARVKDGRITTEDKELLWKAYVTRIHESVVVTRARVPESGDLRYSFVAPMF